MPEIRLAMDRGSVRRYDHDGRLHVELTPISKANVCPYRGDEIPGAAELGLDPNRIYQLFRDPKELEKAAPTSNNIQLMEVHDPVTAGDPKQMKVVGSTGTDALFEAPFLMNSLAVWVKSAIDLIESDEKKELSCAYHYDPDMTPGTYEGARYDGVMRNIRFNHVALVEDGRAGADVVVGDSMPLNLRDVNKEIETMTGTATSRKAIFAQGALAIWLRPKLATDAALPDLKKALLGTTARNWLQAKPMIAQRLKDMTRGTLAKDANMEDVHGFLDSLDRPTEGMDEDDMEGEDARRATDMKAKDAKRARDEGISEEEAREKREAEDARSARDTRRASDESEETEEEREARMKKRADDKAARDKAAKDETPEEKEAREKREAADKRARDAEPKPVSKAAMDSALEKQRVTLLSEWRREQTDLTEALDIVKPVVGVLMAQDSAEAVYRVLFTSEGIDVATVPATAFKALAQQTVRAATAKPAPRLGMDGAAAKGFADRHPEVARIRSI